MVEVTALDHFVLNVRDVETTARWYERVLGMRREEFETGDPNSGLPEFGTSSSEVGNIRLRGRPKRTMLRFGAQRINVRPIAASKVEWFTADHEMPGSEDLCFLTGASPDAVVAHLKACDVAIEAGPDKRSGARGTLMSVYCRDPDGSLIEISSYLE